jgi:hypothetical protein
MVENLEQECSIIRTELPRTVCHDCVCHVTCLKLKDAVLQGSKI